MNGKRLAPLMTMFVIGMIVGNLLSIQQLLAGIAGILFPMLVLIWIEVDNSD